MSKLAMYFKKLIIIFTFLFLTHLYSAEIIIQETQELYMMTLLLQIIRNT